MFFDSVIENNKWIVRIEIPFGLINKAFPLNSPVYMLEDWMDSLQAGLALLAVPPECRVIQ